MGNGANNTLCTVRSREHKEVNEMDMDWHYEFESLEMGAKIEPGVVR